MTSRTATVAIIDGGGRGSALVQKYSQSPHVKKIIAIPGNDLMQINSRVPVVIFQKLKTTSILEIVRICKKYKAGLVDVAQDNAVEAGLADRLIELGFNVMGPTRAAGQIEWDKAWARDFMKKYEIPIPKYKVCISQQEGIGFIKKNPNNRWFVKASGLAEGKGAIPAENAKQAIDAINQMQRFGLSGKTFVIEEWLDGEEFSMFAISDGKSFQVIGSAQDHKRLYDGDLGPNTGGIGCSTPALIVNRTIFKQAKEIIKKAIRGLAKESRPYKGILYLGAIVVRNKVYVIEFNARWGSPEAEVLVPGIKNDFFRLGMSIAKGDLGNLKIKTDGLARIAVTGSLRPGVTSKPRELFGINEVLKLPGVTIFGTRVTKKQNRYLVSSGRLFHVVAESKTVIDARQKAYEAMSLLYIEGDNLHYRTDIGWRDVERMRHPEQSRRGERLKQNGV